MAGGAPAGNKNAEKGKRWAKAIERALALRSKAEGTAALDDLAEKLLLACDAGDISALRELGDRLDGKPQQTVDVNKSVTYGHHFIPTSERLPDPLDTAAGAAARSDPAAVH